MNKNKEFKNIGNIKRELDLENNIHKKTSKDIELPKLGKLISDFIREIAVILKKKDILFYRSDLRQVVEIGKIKHENDIIDSVDKKNVFTGFIPVKPSRFITLAERFFNPGHLLFDKDKNSFEFKQKSMNKDLANTILDSQILEDTLQNISRIFTIPIPIFLGEKLTFPKRGYDKRFNSWLPFNAPKIDSNMEIAEGKKIINSILNEFCFEEEEDKTIAIAGLITPFLRGLYNKSNARTPVYIYMGNRERVGKDYLAGVNGILYEEIAIEEPPLSDGKNKGDSDNELRKKILSTLITGRKRLHFSNNKGYINNAVFEQIITTASYSDRQLGGNKILTFNNELEFSLSGNVGISFTPDLANRSRICRLFYDLEDTNARVFKNPDLHKWVLDNRSKILSAIYSIVKNWVEKGSPDGKVKFASFSEWARICGGIMETAGYDSPCNSSKNILIIGGDIETADMKQLFEFCYELKPEETISRNDIKTMVENAEEIFDYLDLKVRSDQTKFGLKLDKFIGRVLSEIRFKAVDTSGKRKNSHRYVFTKEL